VDIADPLPAEVVAVAIADLLHLQAEAVEVLTDLLPEVAAEAVAVAVLQVEPEEDKCSFNIS
jgi:hypothetical protein